MGLDMYLSANKFLWNTEKETKDKIAEALGMKDIDVQTVKCEAAYWRKANAIHKWFVDNCQGGKDECQNTELEREQLMELRDLCKKVLADHSLAEKLLPTQQGFFFGMYEYNEYYFQDLENTVTMIDKALATFPDGWDFQYRSSW